MLRGNDGRISTLTMIAAIFICCGRASPATGVEKTFFPSRDDAESRSLALGFKGQAFKPRANKLEMFINAIMGE